MQTMRSMRTLSLVLVACALLACGMVIPASASDTAASELPAVIAGTTGPAQHALLPPELSHALDGEYGRYQGLVSGAEFLDALQGADIVCVSEAHYDARDMQTAFEITRLLARTRPVALAVERFSHDLQPALDALNQLPGAELRAAALTAILQTDAYQKIWGNRPKDRSGFPLNTPSKPGFEAMTAWAARAGIPLIGLDVSLSERANGLGEDIPRRNELWASQIERFLLQQRQPHYLVVAVAGDSHCGGAGDSFSSRLKSTATQPNVITVGQRDAMYHTRSALLVQQLAAAYGLDDLIVRGPQFAVVSVDGAAAFPDPPDYWIAAHRPDSWN